LVKEENPNGLQKFNRMAMNASQTISRFFAILTGILLISHGGSGVSFADMELGAPAYWPGTQLAKFVAADNYSSCENGSPPMLTGRVDRIMFDAHDNLWLTPTNLGIAEGLSSSNYTRFETFGLNQSQGLAFDDQGNLWTVVPRGGVGEGGESHVPNLIELLAASGYDSQFRTELKGVAPQDVAIDRAGNLWICDKWNGTRARVLRLAQSRLSTPSSFSTNFPVVRLVAGRDGAMFTRGEYDGSRWPVVQLRAEGSRLVTTREIDRTVGTQAITVDAHGDLWTLGQSPSQPQNRVVEFLSSSGYQQKKHFPIPRRVFALALDRSGNAWVTSPYKNVPYSIPGRPRGQAPIKVATENLTQLDAASGYSKQASFSLPGWPYGIAIDGSGNIWIANGQGYRENVIELLASSRYAQRKIYSVVGEPFGVAVDSGGNVWLTGSFPGCSIVELARNRNYAVARRLQVHAAGNPSALAFDHAGNLWVADPASGYGVVEFLADTNFRDSRAYFIRGDPYALAFDSAGDLWVAADGCPKDRLIELLKPANYKQQRSFAVTGRPYGVAIDARDNVWVSIASVPLFEVTRFSHSNGYTKLTKVELSAGSEAVGIDSHDNIWLQSYDYIEVQGLLNGTQRRPWPW
jgi:streptogramin lyase